jgi:P-type E1-E2 ATPase
MIKLAIPGYETLEIRHLVTDVNGTIATGGVLDNGVIERFAALQQQVEIHMLTADTHGRQAEIDRILNMKAKIITAGASEKASVVWELGKENVIAFGNGVNDVLMCQEAALSIGLMGEEGIAAALLPVVDVVVRDINHGLDLLLYPDRLRATLRK